MKAVALTFDDGPSEWTDDLLDTLAAHDAHATFFVLGSNIPGREATIRRAVADGHELAAHGFDHKPCDDLTAAEITDQLATTCQLLALNGVERLRWWRPPWHIVTDQATEAAEALGLAYCGVTIDGFDVIRSADQILDAVYANVTDGSIVGLHDGVAANGNQSTPHRRNTVEAVGRMLDVLGGYYTFATVSDVLG